MISKERSNSDRDELPVDGKSTDEDGGENAKVWPLRWELKLQYPGRFLAQHHHGCIVWSFKRCREVNQVRDWS